LRELSLHILDIAENSIVTNAQPITIAKEENLTEHIFRITIIDDGNGKPSEMVNNLANPFVTKRKTRSVGHGIPLIEAATEAYIGQFNISTMPNTGTQLSLEFQFSHIDRMP
jgi:nitrogen fixation/metabolism regulation signal transduction histidine kinase